MSIRMTNLCILLFSLFSLLSNKETITVSAQTVIGTDGVDLSGYPTYEAIAPGNSTLTSYFLASRTIPGAPRATGLPPNYGDAVINCGGNRNNWVISYDDGPGMYQQQILDDLSSKKISATFFSVGSSVMRYSASAKKVFDQGHDILIHTWSHLWLTNMTNDQVVAEIYWTAKIIYDVTGRVPRYIRPAFGDMDERVNAIFKAMDVVPIIWNRDTNDYLMNNGNRTAAQTLADVDSWIAQPNPNGVISLQHDRFQQTAAIVPQVNAKILSSQYKHVKLTDCLDINVYGSPYATSGLLYKAITGYDNTSQNPKDNNKTVPIGGNKTSAATAITVSFQSPYTLVSYGLILVALHLFTDFF